MMAPLPRVAIQEALDALSGVSFVAYRDALESLPAIEPHGEDVVLAWLTACRQLFAFDREAGKAFIRGTPEAEKVSETVLPWTHQALQFLK
ncbi:MAG: hypothetical protein HYY79_04545, partial [Betaproteobacteria bacterium]|nr:hypothetical protein [Betaproteobacteria bacterium]